MRKFAIFAAVGACLLSGPAFAQRTSSSSTSAVVVTRLSFVKYDDLEFGAMLAGTTAGTVTVSPSNVRTKTGGVTLAGGTVMAAKFSGYGFPNQMVAISIDANTQTMTRTGGGATMTYSTFVIGSTPTAIITTTPQSFRISSTTGFFAFPIGATLNVAANQMPGYYADTFTITLNYQ